MRTGANRKRRVTAPAACGASIVLWALPAMAQMPSIDDVVAACGGFRMVVAVDAQLPVDEVEAIAASLRDRLGVRGGVMSEVLDTARTDEDGLIEVLRAGVDDLGQPVEAFLARGHALSVHAVEGYQDSPDAPGPGLLTALDADRGDRYIVLHRNPLIAELAISHATLGFDYDGRPSVDIGLTETAALAFGEMSAENIGNPVALMLGDRLLTAPVVQQAIWGGAIQITGSYTVEDVEALAAELTAGAISHPLKVQDSAVIERAGGLDAVCGAIDAK